MLSSKLPRGLQGGTTPFPGGPYIFFRATQSDRMLATAPSSGNTKPSPRPKGRHFQLTLNEPDKYDTLKTYLTNLKTNNYFISCKEEAPTTGHQHIHIYVQFTQYIALGITKLCGAHVEVCRGSPQQNVDYIKKDGEIIDEIGTCRVAGNPTIRDIKGMTQEEIDELPWQMHNTATKIMDRKVNDLDIEDLHKEVTVYYIYGPSGVGKTERAKDIVRENKEKYGTLVNMVKFDGHFWSGIGDTAKIAIYDDFRDSAMKPDEFIHFIDYNVHPMNIKGSSKLNKYELIIITSVQPLDKLYFNMRDQEPRKQWMRRVLAINMMPESKQEDILDVELL